MTDSSTRHGSFNGIGRWRIGRAGVPLALGIVIAAAAAALWPGRGTPTAPAPARPQAMAPGALQPLAPAALRSITAPSLRFETNLGQAVPEARFVARGADFAAEVFDDGVRVSRPARRGADGTPSAAASARLRFVGAATSRPIDPRERAAGSTNYLLGSDRGQWLRDVPSWRQLRQADLYPGIDLVYYGRDSVFEYDLVVHPGADPSRIRIAVSAEAKPKIDAAGDLLLDGAEGKLRMHRPVLYQHVDGKKKTLAGDYVLLAANEVGFRLPEYDRTLPLVIDPTFKLLYSTYLGGVHDDQVGGVVLDAQNNAYVVGNSGSEDFPVSGNAYQNTRKAIGRYVRNVVVTKFDASGTLIYSTFIGGTVNDYGIGIAVDGNGRASITGYTDSPDFPVTANAYQATKIGGRSTYLATLSSDGSALAYSTYYSGTGGSGAANVFVEPGGTLLIGGTAGPGLPTTVGAYKTTLAAGNAVFFARFDTAATGAAQLVAATYWGTDAPQTNFLGSGVFLYTMAVDAAGSPWATGQAYTTNLPVSANPVVASPPAMTPGCSPNQVPLNSFAYVVHLSTDLKSLAYASYLTGNNGGQATCAEYGHGIAFDTAGNVYVGGSTSSLLYPTTAGVPQPTSPANSGFDGYTGFVTKIKADGSAILWSTYLGGNAGRTYLSGLLSDATGALWMYATSSGGSNFPVTADALQKTHGGGTFDVSLTKLDPATAAVQYSTFLGGSGDDGIAGLAFDPSGNAYIAGTSASFNYPTTANAVQPALTPNAYDGADWVFTLLGSGTIGSVRPPTAGNTGDATLHVGGVGIQTGATAALVAADNSSIAAAYFVLDANGGGATLTFALDGKAMGSYALVITNPDGTVLRKNDAFSIGAGSPPSLTTQVIGRAKIRTGVPATYQIVVSNTGGQDAFALPLWLDMPDGLTPAFAGRSIAVTDLAAQSSGGKTYLHMLIPRVAAGETLSIPLVITAPTDMAAIPINATLQAPWFATRAKLSDESVGDGSVAYAPDCVPDPAHPYFSNCVGTYLTYAMAGQRPLAQGAVTTGGAYTRASNGRVQAQGGNDPCKAPNHAQEEHDRGVADGAADLKEAPWGNHYSPPPIKTDPIGNVMYNFGYMTGTIGGVGGAAGAAQAIDPNTPRPQVATTMRVKPLADICNVPPTPIPPPPPPLPPGGSGGGGSGGAIDPNDKIGPRGDGSASHFIRADATLSYQVQFENVATASLPAANVVITDQLDPAKVDLSTFELGAFSFGSTVVPVPAGLKSYAVTVPVGTDLAVRIQGSVDVVTGLVKWTFTTLDPLTHLPPSDPTLGFLPPDTDGMKGQGAVNFSVRQKAGAANGTVYSNRASIVFDANAAILTPTWVNTVDTSLPTSHVQSLAGRVGTMDFDVVWSGSDTGSGVGAYNVYVSDNGGPYVQWQTAVKATTAVYTGTSGHSYAFYARSSDGAGNSEPAKAAAEATIAVNGTFAAPDADSGSGGGGCTIGGDGQRDATLPLLVLLAAAAVFIGRRRAARAPRPRREGR
ncbi:MAG: SBBP repeat-containing protein [Burkholderiales bacterium]|nr:SBBP repeat-containing protein [Burkholderiales bacterium]